MKNIMLSFRKKKTRIYILASFFMIIGSASLITLIYKSIFCFSIKKNDINKELSSRNNSKSFLIRYDHGWYKKQKKYLSGGALYPIKFKTIKNNAEKDKEIIRNGLLLINKNAIATVLICHGFMTSKDDMALMRTILKGYNIMTFDFRAHGEDCIGQHCTFGREEKYDVIAAVNFIKNHPKLKDKPLFVYGFSMGAVASILAQHEEPSLFDGAVWDCPFESTDGLVNRAIDRMKISLFGYNFIIPGSFFLKKYAYHPYVQELVKLFFRTFARMDATQISTIIKPVSPKEAIRDLKIPFLLIGCHNDDKVPPSALIQMYKNAENSIFKRLWIASGRHHFDAFFVNPEKYAYKINEFIKNILNKKFINKKSQKIKEDPCIYCLQ